MNTKLRSGFTLIEIMVVVGIIGLLAAVAIPNLHNAIVTARKQTCALNRQNINGAKLRWSLEHKAPPTATPTDDDLFGQGDYIELKPDCPAGGNYSLNAVQEKCTCTIPVHVD